MESLIIGADVKRQKKLGDWNGVLPESRVVARDGSATDFHSKPPTPTLILTAQSPNLLPVKTSFYSHDFFLSIISTQ